MHRTPSPPWHRTARPARGVWLLLWLLVALLPLRPLASWAMAPEGSASPTAAHAAALADTSPCHGHAAPAAPAVDAGNAGVDPVAQPAPCGACDLCHAAMAGPTVAVQAAAPAPRAAPAAPLLAATRPAPADGVFRPPRA